MPYQASFIVHVLEVAVFYIFIMYLHYRLEDVRYSICSLAGSSLVF